MANKTTFKKGQVPWNLGKKHSQETKDKIRKKALGRPSRLKGIKKKPLSEIAKKHLSKLFQGRILSKEWKEKIGIANKGNKRPDLVKYNKSKEKREQLSKLFTGRKITWGEKISQSRKGKYGGENHPLWRGGISFEPYGLAFTKKLKEKIRKRDNYQCQECLVHQKDILNKRGNQRLLDIHHIDYNKKNNNPNNLISLCKVCHAKTNFNRDDWEKYFLKKVNDRRKV
jgi:hypothetical protein